MKQLTLTLAGRQGRPRTGSRIVTDASSGGRVVAEYTVGAYSVRITESNGVYRYEAHPLIDSELDELISSRLNEILALTRRGVGLVDAVVYATGVDRSLVPEALYVLRSMLGYGKIQVLLDDPFIEDISITGPGPVWVRHRLLSSEPSVDYVESNIVVESMDELVELQQSIAVKCNTYISMSRPIVDAQLLLRDGGHRVHLVSPLISPQRPEIVVRKKPRRPPGVRELVEEGVLPGGVAEYFKLLLEKRGSLIIAGPPGSGKTTLLRSILYTYIPASWKLVIIEDTGEIDPPPGSSWTRYIAVDVGAVKVDLFDLAKAALRASATRLIVVGETRGAEAQVLAQAMLAGMSGLTTFHGGSPEEVIARLSSPPISLPASKIGLFTAIAFMGFTDKPRRALTRLTELYYDAGGDRVDYIDLWVRSRDGMRIGLEEILARSRRLGGASGQG